MLKKAPNRYYNGPASDHFDGSFFLIRGVSNLIHLLIC